MPSAAEQFVIIPYHRQKHRLVPGERRPAQTEAGAIRTAGAMAARHAGILAVACHLDPETGEMLHPREIARYGDAPALETE